MQYTERELSGGSFDQTAVYEATINDLDEQKIRDFFTYKKVPVQVNGSLETLLCDYQFAVREHAKLYPTVAGILLFGKNPQRFSSEAYITCTQFGAFVLAHTDVIASQDFTGTLREQVHAAYDFVGRRLAHSYVIKGPQRVDTLELPIAALREVIINACAHKDYSLPSSIKIALFPDRIEVRFAGSLRQKNVLMGVSSMRNNVICKTFREMGIIEDFGPGFTTLFQEYAAMKLPTPSVIESESFVKCILPRREPGVKQVADDAK